MENIVSKKVEERLPWHKPELERLNVHVDTGLKPGSGSDLNSGTVFPIDR